jgi:MSHA biogenesis protein MshJ
VELRVQGDYLDLMKYMNELQATLPGLRWGELRLAAQGEGAAKAVLQLQLVLASPPP